jgi:peptidoglycan/xylan/chitin deacetylase (PgdA/CDA1 family)
MKGMKHRLRRAVESMADVGGLLDLLERRMGLGLTVLMYHRVLPDESCGDYPFASLAMPASAFRAQLAWLAEHAEVLPLGRALQRSPTRRAKRPLVSVTFDDGYADNKEIAAPMAEELGLRCSFFVATDFVQGSQPLWFDRAHALISRAAHAACVEAWQAAGLAVQAPRLADVSAWISQLKSVEPTLREGFLGCLEAEAGPDLRADLEAVRPMRPDDLRALANSGHEIASHGTGHNVFLTLSDEALERELEESRRRIGSWIGEAPLGLAYPNGDQDERVRAASRRAGYAWACTTRAGMFRWGSDPLQVPRRDVTPSAVLDAERRFDFRAFRCEISGLRQAWRRAGPVSAET